MTDASRKQEDHSNPLSQPENLNSRSTIQEWSETRSREAAHGKAPPGSTWTGLRIARTWSSAKRLAWTGTSARQLMYRECAREACLIPSTIVTLLSHRFPFFLCSLCGFQKTMLWTGDFLGNLRTHRNFVFHLSSPPLRPLPQTLLWVLPVGIGSRSEQTEGERQGGKGVRKTRENQQQVGSKGMAPTGRLSAAGCQVPFCCLFPGYRLQEWAAPKRNKTSLV